MGKNVLIAGASSAMAQQTRELLKNEGYTCIGISTKSGLDGYDVLHTVDQYDTGSLPAMDIPLHGLFYFPGTIRLAPFQRIKKEQFLQDFTINTLGAAMVTRQYLDNLKQAKGAVVFISTVAAQRGFPFHSSIAMAKAGLEGLAKALAAELAPDIRVNVIAPSLTDTPLAERLINTPEKRSGIIAKNPSKRIGNPADIAEMAAFLVQEKAGWITGQVIHVDGGAASVVL